MLRAVGNESIIDNIAEMSCHHVVDMSLSNAREGRRCVSRYIVLRGMSSERDGIVKRGEAKPWRNTARRHFDRELACRYVIVKSFYKCSRKLK